MSAQGRYHDAVLGVVGGRGRTQQPRAVPSPPVEGVVKAVSAAGVTFTVPTWDGGKHVFGPAPWHRGATAPTAVGDHGTHVHAAAPPTPGQRCLVVFVGTSIQQPWVVAWY